MKYYVMQGTRRQNGECYDMFKEHETTNKEDAIKHYNAIKHDSRGWQKDHILITEIDMYDVNPDYAEDDSEDEYIFVDTIRHHEEVIK